MSVALVTGGARGLGRALVLELERRGHAVHVLDVLPPPEAPGDGAVRSAATYHRGDLTCLDPAWVDPLPALDVLVCNAGVTAVGDFATMPLETDRHVLEVNLFGHLALVKRLLAAGKLRRGGHVAFVCSASVWVPWPVGVAYAASKAALDGLALALESYLVPREISVTRVYPGAMRTEHGGYARARNEAVGVEPAAIAPRIVRAILRGRRRVFPDAMGLGLTVACRLFPRSMARLIRRRLDVESLGSSQR